MYAANDYMILYTHNRPCLIHTLYDLFLLSAIDVSMRKKAETNFFVRPTITNMAAPWSAFYKMIDHESHVKLQRYISTWNI